MLEGKTIAISVSESPDMPALGLSNEHLRDAMTEIARYLLSLGARLVYAGDLRKHGFSRLLFELVARHHYNEGVRVRNYLAWPVHISKSADELKEISNDLSEGVQLICLEPNGTPLSMVERMRLEPKQPSSTEWSDGLMAMRLIIQKETDARIVLGGQTDQYKGLMPGVVEEALFSLMTLQPLFLIGGFGGCARAVAEQLGLIEPSERTRLAMACTHLRRVCRLNSRQP